MFGLRLTQLASSGLFGLAFALSVWLPTRRAGRAAFVLGTLLGLGYIGWRYWLAWPMTPMYLGTVAVPPVLAVMVLVTEQGNYGHSQKIWGAASLLAGLLGMVCWLFPKDFYLPFLKTATVFSHLHLAFTVLGKAAFLLAGLWGGCFFRAGQGSPEVYKRRLTSLTALGFGFWTLSMFSGEIWSYRGWGLAVVWDDAVIVTFMATWFFFTGILHLYLTRLGTTGTRAALAVAGLVWVLLVNCWSDLGPYRPPVFRP